MRKNLKISYGLNIKLFLKIHGIGILESPHLFYGAKFVLLSSNEFTISKKSHVANMFKRS